MAWTYLSDHPLFKYQGLSRLAQNHKIAAAHAAALPQTITTQPTHSIHDQSEMKYDQK